MAKTKELAALSIADLETQISTLEKSLFDLRMKLNLHQLSNTAEIRATKHNLAQLKTFRTQKLQQKGAQ
jgi:ribosomal protein L29